MSVILGEGEIKQWNADRGFGLLLLHHSKVALLAKKAVILIDPGSEVQNPHTL
jgi:hypothetical protein